MTDLLTTKRCPGCGEDKPLTDYHRQAKSRDGRAYACKMCCCARTRKWRKANVSREDHAAQMRAWKAANPEKYKATRLRARLGKYSLTPDEYMAKLLAQKGRCGACGSDDPGSSYGVWCIDHDRSCCPGKFSCGECLRDLLCNGCNTALGLAREDVDRLLLLAEYARRWRRG